MVARPMAVKTVPITNRGRSLLDSSQQPLEVLEQAEESSCPVGIAEVVVVLDCTITSSSLERVRVVLTWLDILYWGLKFLKVSN